MWAPDAVRAVLPAAQALEHAHEKGIFHRDVTPNNILMFDSLLQEDGQSALLDFGLAHSSLPTNVPDGDKVVGTMGYIPPEYLAGGAFDARSDRVVVGRIAV